MAPSQAIFDCCRGNLLLLTPPLPSRLKVIMALHCGAAGRRGWRCVSMRLCPKSMSVCDVSVSRALPVTKQKAASLVCTG